MKPISEMTIRDLVVHYAILENKIHNCGTSPEEVVRAAMQQTEILVETQCRDELAKEIAKVTE